VTFSNFIILFASIVIDASFSAKLGPVILTPHLSTLFLLYLGFRRPFAPVFAVVAAFVVMSRPFTGLNFAGIALSHWGVLYVVCRLRRKMFAESYLTNAAWVVLFSWILQWFSDFEPGGSGFFRFAAWRAVEITANGLVMGLLTVPSFMLLDSWYETRGFRRRTAA
jgi:hypothetical protein